MPGYNYQPSSRHTHHRARYAVVLTVLLFAALAAVPLIRTELHIGLPRPLTSSAGVRLLPAPKALPAVQLARAATPIAANDPPAAAPAVNPAEEAAVVAAEDSRVRILLHDSIRIFQPQIVSVRGALPTLILPPGAAAYTAADLVQYGALVMRPHHVGLLIDNVFATANARLNLGWPRLRALYLDSTASGIASIVSWGGTLDFSGTASHPLTIMGWDHQLNAPAADRGGGRAYIRAVGGRMELTDARISSLGFWSGRTGGVAWTGISGRSSTGGARSSTFTDDAYGAFIERSHNMTFSDDLFEFNQLDGLHIHRYTVDSAVTASSAVRNGGNGFVVDPASQGTIMRGDLAEHNRGDGFLIDSQPLVRGASASGNAVVPGSGTRVETAAALGNLRDGILVEGGAGTVLRADSICAPLTGIVVRTGAVGTILTGDDVRCGPRVGLEIGPNASGTVVAGNSVVGARIGMLVRNVSTLRADNNVISAATLFGITVRGSTSQVSGVDNVISGTGFRAVDARADARVPALVGTETDGWQTHVTLSPLNYLQFHPLAALWLSVLVLLLTGALWSRRKPLPVHPYVASTRWQAVAAAGPPLNVALEAAREQVSREQIVGRGPAWPSQAPRPSQAPWAPAPSPEIIQTTRAHAAALPPTLVGAAVGSTAERDRDRPGGSSATRAPELSGTRDDPAWDPSATRPLPRIR